MHRNAAWLSQRCLTKRKVVIMRFLKTLGVALVALLAVGVTMVATASAADPLFLFAGQTGTISEGKATLTTLTGFFAITCEKSTGKVNAANDSETFTGEIEFKECTGNSLGSPAGVIKFKFKGLTCLWGAENELKPCAYIETTENVHIELGFFGLLDFLIGSSLVCKLTPDGIATTDLRMAFEKSANGDPLLTSVKDLEVTLKPEIKVLENHESPETHGVITATFLITFAKAGTLDG
jgi:hypothetical protein